MVKNKVIKIVEYLSSRLEANGVDVSDIILFGSQARGDARRGSDIDLIIISNFFRGKNIFERAEMVGPAEMETIKKYNVPFDIIIKTREEYKSGKSLIAGYAMEEGISYNGLVF
jgi:predicted nucleotidyltransferase